MASASPAIASLDAIDETGPIHVYEGRLADGPQADRVLAIGPEHADDVLDTATATDPGDRSESLTALRDAIRGAFG